MRKAIIGATLAAILLACGGAAAKTGEPCDHPGDTVGHGGRVLVCTPITPDKNVWS